MDWDQIILIALKILAVLVLVLLNGFFVAAELALVRIRDTQLASLAARGNHRARTARHIVAHIDSYIGATQFGITLASLGLGVAVEPVFRDLLNPLFNLLAIESEHLRHVIAVGVGFFINCYLLIVVGELVPKAVAIRRTLPTALLTASLLAWFYRISFPFIWLLHRSSQLIVNWLGIGADDLRGVQSEEELRLVLATTPGMAGERNLILNALDLRHRVAREIMRPRREIVVFDTEATMKKCLELAEQTRHARFPICDGGDLDKMRGVVHIKDLYPAALSGGARTAADLLPVARKLIYIPATARLEKVLRLFRERRVHFAVVVDEYGGTLGIVTLENTMEALVGQIQDEFDQEQTIFFRREKNVWEVAGALPLHELEKITGTLPRDEGVATVSGWVTQRLGGFPKAGDTLAAGTCELRVEEMDGPRVARLKIIKREAPDGPEI